MYSPSWIHGYACMRNNFSNVSSRQRRTYASPGGGILFTEGGIIASFPMYDMRLSDSMIYWCAGVSKLSAQATTIRIEDLLAILARLMNIFIQVFIQVTLGDNLFKITLEMKSVTDALTCPRFKRHYIIALFLQRTYMLYVLRSTSYSCLNYARETIHKRGYPPEHAQGSARRTA